MKLLHLAKEIGMPYERLLAWCVGAGFPYRSPEDEVAETDSAKIRSILARRFDSKSEEPQEETFETLMEDEDLSTKGFPRTLDELEVLEDQWIQSPAAPSRKPVFKEPAKSGASLKDLLESFGITGKNTVRRVRRLLPEHLARLLNHAELSIDEIAALREAISEKVPLCCGDAACLALLAKQGDEKDIVVVALPSCCRICRGSSTRRMLEEMGEVCREEGTRRILVLGGSPPSHSELRDGAPPGLELRLIEGESPREKHRPAAEVQWCDLVVIWVGTILSHALTSQYTRSIKAAGKPMIIVRRRSVEALCSEVIGFLRKRKETGK